MNTETDSIVALSTPSGEGGVAVIRMSGSDALVRATTLIERKAPLSPRRVYLANIKDPATGEQLDKSLVLGFRGPNSFTGEDIVEIHCHGGPYIVQRVLKACLSAGFRAAEPGEFTRRAVMNGKMDLTEAEGLRELIGARSEQEWRAGKQLADGHLKQAIAGMRRRLLDALAWLEARIDFPDEGDTSDVSLAQVSQHVESALAALTRLSETYTSGRISADGLRVCLLGAPNAGKSSLMNNLLGHERAIVSEVAGTTRDYIEEKCLVEGRLIRLIDMAGIRESADLVEQLGVQRAQELARSADIILLVTPVTDFAEDCNALESWLTQQGLKSPVVVVTKTDLAPEERLPPGAIGVSNLTGSGIPALRKQLAGLVDSHIAPLVAAETWLTNARHLECVDRAREHLNVVTEMIAAARGDQDEFMAFELRQAASALGLLIGEVYADDVLDVVFSSFCIGK